LHWAFFQSVAWFGMVLTYAHTAPVTEALLKTFDGKHRCQLCKQIEKSRQAEKKPVQQIEIKKPSFLLLQEPYVFVAPSNFYVVGWPFSQPRDWSKSPSFPPPRLHA
jgi:hypothetical protein